MTDAERLLAHLLARKQKVKRLARKRTTSRPREPRNVEMAYERALVALNARMVAAVKAVIKPHLAAARARENTRTDAEIDATFFGVDFGVLRLRLAKMVQKGAVSPLVDKAGRQLRDWNTEEIMRLLSIDLRDESPAIQAILAEWREENVDLIKSISERLLGDVFETVTEAATKGTRVETLAKQLEERYEVSDSRARLIARDQILKANAQFTEARHREAGIDRYLWSTSRDERVRPMHKELEGQIFSWSEPPVTNPKGDRNHPGEDYQCRCVAVPVLDDE